MTQIRLLAVAGIIGTVVLAWRGSKEDWPAQLLWTAAVLLCIGLAARDYMRGPRP